MKKIIFTIALAVAAKMLFAQTWDEYETQARGQLVAGDVDKACKTLEAGLQKYPGNLELSKDQVLAYTAKRDFATAINLGLTLAYRSDADVQCFQLLGTAYKDIAQYKEGAKMYRAAIEKFPRAGMLYAEYGDLLLQDKKEKDAITVLEQGIQADVNISGNYYYAAKYYLANDFTLQGLLYGEIFVNLESFTDRSKEMQGLLYAGYKKLFAGGSLTKTAGDGKDFINLVAGILAKDAPQKGDSINIASISQARWKFILDWDAAGYTKQYPFRLFDLHEQLTGMKAFDAYNQWLFGTAEDADKFEDWQTAHAAEMQQWLQLLHNVVFKIPAHQYYGI